MFVQGLAEWLNPFHVQRLVAGNYSIQWQHPNSLSFQVADASGSEFGVKCAQTVGLEHRVDLGAIAQLIQGPGKDRALLPVRVYSIALRIAAPAT
jgi:hypothetical protein